VTAATPTRHISRGDALAAMRQRRVSFTKVAVTCLKIFTSGSANQRLDNAHDLAEAWPPTRAVRAKRALRSVPVVLVRGVRVPAYTETGAPIFIVHSLRILPLGKGGHVGNS
jgi:hypothetical protein